MKKAILGFWEFWNMSFGFLRMQFGFALLGGFMFRIFQTLGVAKDDIPLLWIAAPFTTFCNLLLTKPDANSYREKLT